MKFAVMFGSDLYVGTSGVLTYEHAGKEHEFFRIREINRVRSSGSYVVVDCDIKDADSKREVKLFKSRPVVGSSGLKVDNIEKGIKICRADGSTVIKIEELLPDDSRLPKSNRVVKALREIDAILRITGNFYAGPYLIRASESELRVGVLTLSGNLKIGTGGLKLSESGFAI